MKNYIKPEIEMLVLEEVDVITTSNEDVEENLITWGGMSKNINSEDVGLFQ